MEKKKVIIDCDPGYDDAAALLLAAHSPELDIVGITCVAGNVEVEKTAANALRLCELAGIKTVPVLRGMTKPLCGNLITAAYVHGPSGLDGVPLPETDLTLHPGHAVDFLIETIMASDDDITVIPIAPLTNIAMAILREPRVVSKIPQIVLMGGAVGRGNATPSAEFNIYADPEAAHIVFTSGIPIIMVGLDATHHALLRQEHLDRLRQESTPVAATMAMMFEVYREAVARLGAHEYAAMHDACAVAAVCDPSLIRTQLMRVDIETTGTFTRGRTVCAPYAVEGRTPNVEVAVDLDTDRFFQILLERLA